MQGRGNRIDFMGGLEVGGAESRRNQPRLGREETLGQITGMEGEHFRDEGGTQGHENFMRDMDAEPGKASWGGTGTFTKPQNL